MKISGRRILPALAIAITLTIGILIGTLVSNGVRAAKGSSNGAPDATLLPAPSPADLSTSFARVAEMVEPSVVNINTESVVRVSDRFHVPEDSPFGDFFDRFFQFGPEGRGPRTEFSQPSLGSGVILDKNGYILTNYHVIMQSRGDKPVDKIRVQLHGDDSNLNGYPAKIVGKDKDTDLAVIKIDVDRALPFAQFGDSDSMRVGDWVLAIGSPFGLESTVTAGILSAKGRGIEPGTEGQFKRYLQTDAAINPGNSGGPLVNLAGQVIGINTAIATNRGTYDGVGFAVPSSTARKIYNQLISTGSVRRGAIGVTFDGRTNPSLLRSFGADHGVVVNNVEPDSPAEHAGLERGDVITAINGEPVESGDELVTIVSETEPGKKLKVDLLRDRKAKTVEIEVGDRNQVISQMGRGREGGEGEGESPESAGGILGVSVRNLTQEQADDIAKELDLATPQGVIVTNIKAGGFASDVGLSRGDIILAINHQPVHSASDVSDWQKKLKSGDDVLFFIARRTQRTFTTYYLADRLP